MTVTKGAVVMVAVDVDVISLVKVRRMVRAYVEDFPETVSH